jgi:phage FluMu protein Com
MPIRFRCQDCRSRVKVPEGSQGKQVKCPRCGRIQQVPQHQSQAAEHKADGVTVHTCVGSIHRAPKRKEALVGTGVDSHTREFDSDDSGCGVSDGDVSRSGDSKSGDSGGGLEIPQRSDHGFDHDKQPDQLTRKQRRRIAAKAREAEQKRQEAIAREEAAQEQDSIAESRRCVADLFATSHKNKQSDEEAESSPDSAPAPEVIQTTAAPSVTPPEPIALQGTQPLDQEPESVEPNEPAVEHKAEQWEVDEAKPQPVAHAREADGRWTLDLTSEAYPFLRVIPWVLRVTALMLIGPAFKVMLVADAQGFSGVVSMLILFAGLAIVVVTWTVGEIATAVRDIALKKVAG